MDLEFSKTDKVIFVSQKEMISWCFGFMFFQTLSKTVNELFNLSSNSILSSIES